MTNKVKVVICGKDFMLQTEESANYVIGLARTLENRISEVSGSNSSTSPFAAANRRYHFYYNAFFGKRKDFL